MRPATEAARARHPPLPPPVTPIFAHSHTWRCACDAANHRDHPPFYPAQALRRAAGDIIASAASGHAAGIAADTSDCGESAEGAGADADTPPPALVARAAALATALDAAQRRPPPFPHLPTAAVDAVRDSVLSRAGDVWGAKLLRRVGL